MRSLSRKSFADLAEDTQDEANTWYDGLLTANQPLNNFMDRYIDSEVRWIRLLTTAILILVLGVWTVVWWAFTIRACVQLIQTAPQTPFGILERFGATESLLNELSDEYDEICALNGKAAADRWRRRLYRREIPPLLWRALTRAIEQLLSYARRG